MPKDEWKNATIKRTKKEQRITFGKYSGQLLTTIPHDYLEWLLESGAGLAWEDEIKRILKIDK